MSNEYAPREQFSVLITIYVLKLKLKQNLLTLNEQKVPEFLVILKNRWAGQRWTENWNIFFGEHR